MEVTPFAIVGTIIHSLEPYTVTVVEDSFVAVQDGKIVAVENVDKLSEIQAQYSIPDENVRRLDAGEFLCPGFVDTHIHAPQYPNTGIGLDMPLMEWLDTYTFPLESKYSDLDFAKTVYHSVVAKTLSYGTTTACYFATIHTDGALALVDSITELGQRGFVGKVNMNQNSPQELTETTAQSISESEKFIIALLDKKNPLVQPIITPRFAVSCDMNLMQLLAGLSQKYGIHIQTHVSENTDEVDLVSQLYPEYGSYSAVYDAAHLLTDKTVLAHGIYLKDEELSLIASKGTCVAHCPNSNTSLKSGLCDVRRLQAANITVGLGTDVSGGYSPSIINAMQSALAVSNILSMQNDKTYKSLNYEEVFYLATLGGAKALNLDETIGNLVVGKDFDALVVDVRPTDLLQNYTALELLQKFIYLGDDRTIREVYVAGRQVRNTAFL